MYCQYKIGAIIQLLWTLQWRKTLWVWRSENTEVHGGHWWRNVLCALNLISKFVLLSLGRYLCVWTICPRVYHPPSSQCLFNLSLIRTRSIYYIFWKSREAIPIIHSWWFRAGIITPFGETVFISGFCEVRVVHFVQLHVFTYFYSVLWCPLSFMV